jgi:hypothetical protein
MVNTPSFAASSLDFAELSPGFIVRVGNVNKEENPSINRAGFSFDGGANWFQASSEPGGVTGGGTVAAAANASRVLWSPAGAAPHFSTNNGSSWTASSGIPTGAIVEADRVNPMKFYGVANGTFYASTNGGASFTAAATGLPTPAQFKAVPGREGDIWLAGGSETTSYGMWHSTNSGASFTRLANIEEADNIGFGMAAPGQSYPALYTSAQIGSVRGIYRSTDAGATWVRINDDQHQYGHTGGAITGDPRVFGRVYIATNGRGIIYGESGVTTPTPDFSLSTNASSVSVTRGASGTSTISIARSGGFTGSVAFSVSGLPSGVTASFSPASTTGAASVLTLSASSTATTGPASLTITAAGGGLTRTTTLALTVNATSDGGSGGVSVTPVVTSSSPWFNEQQVRVSNTATLTALAITVVVQRTTGISAGGQYNTVGGQVQQSSSSTAAAITYQFVLASGQSLSPANNRSFAVQMSGNGTAHPASGDTYTVTYTTGGQSYTQTGTF